MLDIIITSITRSGIITSSFTNIIITNKALVDQHSLTVAGQLLLLLLLHLEDAVVVWRLVLPQHDAGDCDGVLNMMMMIRSLRSPLLPDDASDEGSDDEEEEDGGKDHDDADAGAVVQMSSKTGSSHQT